MQQASATRLRCDPTDYARKQQEKKDRAKELKEQRTRGVFQEEHTFTPKVNPRAKGAPSSREEDERPAPDMQCGSQYDDIPIRPSKTLQSTRKEILAPDEPPARSAAASKRSTGNSSRPNNNDDHHQASDSLDTLARKFPKKAATAREPEDAGVYSPSARAQPEHDSLHREVKRTTGRDLEDMPIPKLSGGGGVNSSKHTGPCLRNSSCGCPECSGTGGGASVRAGPPARRREPVARQSEGDSYALVTNTSRSANGAQSEMENSLTLLKSKMSRRKARTAPSNQASLYDDDVPQMSKSARQPARNAYAEPTPSASNRRPSQQQAAPAQQPVLNARASMTQPPARKPTQPSRNDDERSAGNGRKQLSRHQEVEEGDNYHHSAQPISTGAELPDEYAEDVGEMEECDNCHRRFNVVSLVKHRKVCEKVFSGPRKVFDMTAKRLEGTEAEKLLKEGKKKGGKRGSAAAADEKPIRAKAVDWKQQSNAFRDAMRANRDIGQALKDGKPLPPMAPSAPDPSLILCDYCGRRFNDKAADRHITFCKEKAQRSGGGPPKKPAAAAAKPAAAASRAPPPRKR